MIDNQLNIDQINENKEYMKNLMFEQVPWHRLTTAYGRASDIVNHFQTLRQSLNQEDVKKALNEITTHIEHQNTFWHSTPFAMVFLVRLFEEVLPEVNTNAIAQCIISKLLDFFEVIAYNFHEMDDMEHEKPLAKFSDMLKEEYLWSEEYDEEEDEMMWEELSFPDDLFYSFYYYSYQTILLIQPQLSLLENSPVLQEKVKELQEQFQHEKDDDDDDDENDDGENDNDLKIR